MNNVFPVAREEGDSGPADHQPASPDTSRLAETRARALRRNYLFATLSDQQFQRIQPTIRVVTLASNELLFEDQQKADRFFLLTKGMIKLSRLSVNGAEKVIEIIRPGEAFAVALMFLDKPAYPVSAYALRPCEVLSVDNASYLGILRESPEACFRVMGEMSRRLQRSVRQIDHLCLQNATYRLIHYLLEQLAGQIPKTDQVILMAPKHVIASSLSIQPETFSRILRTLSRLGLIVVDNRVIRVPSETELQQYADSCETCRTRDK